MQLLDKSIRGSIPALRTYFGQYQIALEKEALLEATQAGEVERRKDIRNSTDEELAQLIFEEEKKEEEQRKKRLLNSNAD